MGTTVDEHHADETLATRLRNARDSAKLTQAQVAAEMGMSRPTLISIEKGTRPVSPTELVKFAELYEKDVSSLLRPVSPPASIRARFRTGLVTSTNEGDLDQAVDELERFADNYLDLLRRSQVRLPGRPPATHPVDYLGPDRAGEALATEERNRLGLGDGPLQQMREVLEVEVGLRVFFLDLPSKVAGLFIYVDPLGGCVGVNRNHPPQRRRWTMAHEYAHYLASRDRPEITRLGRGRINDTERLAESFAANFLMPRNGIIRRFHELKQDNAGKATPATLVQLAHTYRVSVQALCLRLEDLDLIPAGTWDRLKANKFQPRAAADLLNLSHQPEGGDPLPYHYRTLATQLYLDGDITETQYAHYLDMSIIDARKEFQNLTSTRDVSDDGQAQIVDLLDSVE
ncbi:XRE family transcriptional regulator [Amycolatopsis sp. NPDC004625]|uniref:helix-turn-helix domain-containing protein n=1 Tax=Amycolatopsis sp. NPDC004625 TaxID=3154670 RepID=UPI0033ACF877